MIKQFFAYSFCITNAIIFIIVGIEVANVTVEQAALEGMTQRVYASISYVDYMMTATWIVLAIAIMQGRRDLFLGTAWFYLGLIVCDAVISHFMSVEANDPTFTPMLLSLMVMQSIFLYWAIGRFSTAPNSSDAGAVGKVQLSGR
ncbi:hypothetical protein HBA55_21550 [Pseudomaricurvus alkylphenolicus]|uniref:hypothetical protein n=1 Tax=Pseudomaricurvus alkylphenolicus TaxID=1306991 RepID=UPI0014210CD4|nr:hypothetical protein [Pseudomaricurvus alkylphenolicus]NIB42207.1 hypothetical protein [Pseudomaricurvus alkylphenolicus]